MGRFSRRDLLAGSSALGAIGLIRPALAQAVAEFYRGKRMNLITTASPGGGYDQYARLLARHMPRHIPGEPTITVQNMVGAEGLKAANHLYAVAPQDGSVIGGDVIANGRGPAMGISGWDGRIVPPRIGDEDVVGGLVCGHRGGMVP